MALLDLIKFHGLENEKEQTDFIKSGDEHFISLLKMITNRLLKTGTKHKLLKPITKRHLKAIKHSVDKHDAVRHIIDVNTLHGGGIFDMIKGFGSSIASGLGGLGSSIASGLGGLGSIGSSIMKNVGGLGSSLSSMFSKGLGSLSGGLGSLGSSLLEGAKTHGPGLLKSGLKQGLNLGLNFVPGGATINSLISPHVNKWIDKGVDGAVNYFSKPATGGALKLKNSKNMNADEGAGFLDFFPVLGKLFGGDLEPDKLPAHLRAQLVQKGSTYNESD